MLAPALLLLAGLTAAAPPEDALRVELLPRAQAGQGQPELRVHALEALRSLSLELAPRSGGKPLRQRAGALAAGASHAFPLKLARPGEETLAGALVARLADGRVARLPLELAVALLAPLEVTVAAADLDLDAREVTVRASRPLASVVVAVVDDTGEPAAEASQEVAGDPVAGYRVTWAATPGRPVRLTVTGRDAHGFFAGIELYPWRVDIPHEEVLFRSGLAELDANEVPKLEATYALLDEAVRRYGRLAPIRLFVAGHTDSVGDAAANRALSQQRARALGRWFRRRGLAIPVLFTGLGEDALLVETADEVDEPRNRRAEYIVSVDAPPVRAGAPFRPLD